MKLHRNSFPVTQQLMTPLLYQNGLNWISCWWQKWPNLKDSVKMWKIMLWSFVWGKAYGNLCVICIEERYKSPFTFSVVTVKAVSLYLRVYLRGWTLFSSSELISISKISSVPVEEIWSSFLLSCLYFFLLLFFFFTEPGVNTVSVSTVCGISEFAHVLSFSPDFKWLSVSLKNWSSVGIGDVAKYAGTFS